MHSWRVEVSGRARRVSADHSSFLLPALMHNIYSMCDSAIIKFGPFRVKLELTYNFTVCVTVPSRYIRIHNIIYIWNNRPIRITR